MTDDVGRIPAQYQNFMQVFGNVMAEPLPPDMPTDHAIDLKPNYKLPYGRIYNLTEFDVKMHKAYI